MLLLESINLVQLLGFLSEIGISVSEQAVLPVEDPFAILHLISTLYHHASC